MSYIGRLVEEKGMAYAKGGSCAFTSRYCEVEDGSDP